MSGEHNIRKAYKSILNHDFERAIEFFELAVSEEPNNAAYHYRLSITYARSGKLAKALTYAENACQLDPDHKEYQYHLQHLLSMQYTQRAEQWMDTKPNGAAQALPLLVEAVKLDPLSKEAYILMAVAYLEIDDSHNAVQAAKEALKLDPQHEGAMKVWIQAKQQLTLQLRSKEGTGDHTDDTTD
jgi:tetratricopeptide (TPR) repeat protein